MDVPARLLRAAHLFGVLLGGLHRRGLGLPVEGGDDPQAAAVDLILGEIVGEQLPAHQVEQEALRPAHRGILLHLRELRQLVIELQPLDVGDPPHLDQAVERVLVALEQIGRLLVAVGRVKVGRRVDDRGERHRLGQVKLRLRLAEVGLAGRLDAVGASSEVDSVEVALEDLLLGALLADLDRQQDLPRLAGEALLLGEVHHLDVLLGDRGAADRLLTAHQRARGPRQRGDVEARVRPEGAVLGCHDRVHDQRVHLLERDRDPVLHLEGPQLGLAIGVVDEGGVGAEVGVRIGDLDAGVGDDHRGGADHAQPEHDAEEPAERPQPRVAFALGLLGRSGPGRLSHRCPRRFVDAGAAGGGPRPPAGRRRSCGSSCSRGRPRPPAP